MSPSADSDAAVIAGVAEVQYRRRAPSDATTAGLLAEAFQSALASAGLDAGDVDGLGLASFTLAPDRCADLAWRMGLRLSWSMENGGGGAALNMLQHALRAVESGQARTIVLVSGGVDRPGQSADLLANFNTATRDHLSPIPFHGPNSLFAMLTARHMRAHGLTRGHYGAIVVSQRGFAALNPGAVYRDHLSIEDYLAAPIVADPLCIYDCAPGVSGADAVVVTTRARAQKAVEVMALKTTVNRQPDDAEGMSTGLAAIAPTLWSEADIGPDDVDVISVYDDYPVMVLIQLADLEFVPTLDFDRFVEAELVEGRLALNTSGGMLSAGQARGSAGMHGLVEAVRQLRAEAGDRQVDGCRFAAVTGYGMVAYRHGLVANAAVLERLP